MTAESTYKKLITANKYACGSRRAWMRNFCFNALDELTVSFLRVSISHFFSSGFRKFAVSGNCASRHQSHKHRRKIRTSGMTKAELIAMMTVTVMLPVNFGAAVLQAATQPMPSSRNCDAMYSLALHECTSVSLTIHDQPARPPMLAWRVSMMTRLLNRPNRPVHLFYRVGQ